MQNGKLSIHPIERLRSVLTSIDLSTTHALPVYLLQPHSWARQVVRHTPSCRGTSAMAMLTDAAKVVH